MSRLGIVAGFALLIVAIIIGAGGLELLAVPIGVAGIAMAARSFYGPALLSVGPQGFTFQEIREKIAVALWSADGVRDPDVAHVLEAETFEELITRMAKLARRPPRIDASLSREIQRAARRHGSTGRLTSE